MSVLLCLRLGCDTSHRVFNKGGGILKLDREQMKQREVIEMVRSEFSKGVVGKGVKENGLTKET